MKICKYSFLRNQAALLTLMSLIMLSGSLVAGAQTTFIDDAQRSVMLPAKVERVFAAGAPAEVLLYTLAPDKLVGRNHMPSPAALEFMPPALRTPIQIKRLPNAHNAEQDAELLALKPDVYIDYGDVNEDYVDSVVNVQQRTGVPAIILDGALERIPATYRKLVVALGMTKRGELLAKRTEHILNKYRNVLNKNGHAPRVYIACSGDVSIPCLDGERSGEVVHFIGASNVAGTAATAPARTITVADIKAWNPEAIVVGSAAAAEHMRNDVEWQTINAIAAKRIYAPPSLPFNWGPRPPSVNRLMGLMWLAYVLPGREFDAAFFTDLRNFFKDFYHVTLNDAQMRRLVAQQ